MAIQGELIDHSSEYQSSMNTHHRYKYAIYRHLSCYLQPIHYSNSRHYYPYLQTQNPRCILLLARKYYYQLGVSISRKIVLSRAIRHELYILDNRTRHLPQLMFDQTSKHIPIPCYRHRQHWFWNNNVHIRPIFP